MPTFVHVRIKAYSKLTRNNVVPYSEGRNHLILPLSINLPTFDNLRINVYEKLTKNIVVQASEARNY